MDTGWNHLGRMSRPALGALAFLFSSLLCNGQAAVADEPIRQGDRLIFPEGAAIPRYETQTEQEFLRDHPVQIEYRVSAPPTGPVHCVAEYEPMEGLLMAWESFTTILTQMAQQVTTVGDADVYMVVDSSSEMTTAASALAAGGVNMSRVHFVIRTTDSVWIRDYGPRYIYQGNCRAIVDHIYNRPLRPNDDVFPGYFATVKGHAIYDLPLIHGGGNYHLNALNESNATRLVVNENPSLTEQQIHDLWQAYQNVDTTFWTPFPTSIDSTQHIDMWMQIVADDVIVISDWPLNSGSTQDVICDNAAAAFQGWGWTVVRVPAFSVSGVHYTYTNVVMCNNLVLVPTYTNGTVSPYNAQALAAWQTAAPGKVITPINCQAIIPSAGALHCIVMHVPVPPGGVSPTTYLVNLRGGEVLTPGQQVQINWISDDDVDVTSVDLLLSTDGGATWGRTIVSGTADDGSHTWTVPNFYASAGRLRVVVHDADGRTGTDESDSNFSIDGVFGDYDLNGVADLDDLIEWPDCMTGPDAGPYAPGCEVFNADGDSDVDLGDFQAEQEQLGQ